MDTQPAVVKPEGRNERVNAVAMALFAIMTLALAIPGSLSEAKLGTWAALFAAVLGMAATCEGVPFARWRRGVALLAAGTVLVASGLKLFSYDLSTVIYKSFAYVMVLGGFALIGTGLRKYFADLPAIFLVTAGMVLMAIVAAGAAVLSLGMKLVAFDLAAVVLAACCVALGTVVAVMSLFYQNWVEANPRPAEDRWQARVDMGGA